MRIRRKVLSLLLAAALPGSVFAQEEPENSPEVSGEPGVSAQAAETSGSCGEYKGRIEDGIPYVYVWSQSLTWTLDSDGTLTISGSGEMGDFVFEEYGSTIIRPWDAVKDSIRKVVVEEGVPTVSDYAFFNCEALTEVEVAGSVRSIGKNAFGVCGKLTRAVIRPGSGCILGDYAFSSCPALTDLSLGEGVSFLGMYAFSGCSGLTDVSLPESIRTVGSYSFYRCTGLTGIVLPERTEKVGYDAFEGCESLKKVTAQEGLTLPPLPSGTETETYTGPTPGTGGGETGGSTGENPGGNTGENPGGDTPAPPAETVSSGLCGKTGTSVSYLLDSNGLLTIRGTGEMGDYTSYALPSWSRYDVKTLVIEEGVTSAGAYAFYNCGALESVELPESLTAIGGYAFAGCTALSSVTIPPAVTSLGYGAFQNCSGLKEARVPLRLKKSAQGMFPDACAVTYYGTTGGECGKNGDNVTWTLDGDGLLTIQGSGEMKDYRPYIAESPWSTEAVKAVVVRKGVTKVGDLAFGDLTALESAELPEGLTVIGNNAFNGCTALTEITLPRSLERVAGTAFRHSGLTRVRVFYKTVFASSLFPTDSSAFPGDCLVSLYGKDLMPEEPLRAARTAPAGSDNMHAGSGVEYSYLAAGDGGGFYRVDYYKETGLGMEEYGPGGAFYQGWDIPMELPLFGGFYAGSDGFYFVFGQKNTQESDIVEVLRVVKYSKDWSAWEPPGLWAGTPNTPLTPPAAGWPRGTDCFTSTLGTRCINPRTAITTRPA